MTVTRADLEKLESHWAVAAVGSQSGYAAEIADTRLVRDAVGQQLEIPFLENPNASELLDRVATAYEMAAIEGLDAVLHPSGSEDNRHLREQAKAGAYRAFEMRRALEVPEEANSRIFHLLHLAALAYCGDRASDLRRWLAEHADAELNPVVEDTSWDQRVLVRLYECWVRLLRKSGWEDLNGVSGIVSNLRQEQRLYESETLSRPDAPTARAVAFRLIALYHWARATEILAIYMLQGEPATVRTELDEHFEAAQRAAMASQDPALDILMRWLHVAARSMAAGSLWQVARTSDSRLADFVGNVTKTQALFELLPPQQAALQEQGLLDQANRAIIVDMPTSGGKTLLAEFRILQALNQFDRDNGWVAYVAPTRALVGQLTRRLRQDFGPAGINVEQLTAAVEIDGFEEQLLRDESGASSFHVLIATPEKLHLVIRNKKISRPLALIVMDEAHNIEDEERGLRIELLLATVKRDCPSANFLLLMPNVANAADLAKWLSPESGKTVSLGTSAWQPNERIVGMFDIKRELEAPPGAWSLRFETLTTSPGTIELHGRHAVGHTKPLNLPFNKAKTLTNMAGAMAKIFSDRGTSIAVARTIRDAWTMARRVAESLEPLAEVPEEIALVQRFLATEISPQFELIGMLSHGVAVHHAGLSDETRSLVEWLAEIGKLRVLCATTGIAQGINFPVSSVFLATLQRRYGKEMPKREFWNLAGRAGRIGQDSVGVVGLAAGERPDEIKRYVSEATGELISRLVRLLDEVEQAGQLADLTLLLAGDQWTDFRIYIAHLWNEKRNLDSVLSETEQLLRNTFGYGVLQSKSDDTSRRKTRALLEATRSYARRLDRNPESAVLADATGFSPEGVNEAIRSLGRLEERLSIADWKPSSLFGDRATSALPQLVGVMMRIPALRDELEELGSHGTDYRHIANIAQAWVGGQSVEEIAKRFFSGSPDKSVPLTDALTRACRGIYRTLGYAGTWGLAALSKVPNSGIDFDRLSEEDERLLNNLPAMLYHGVQTGEGVLMRMNAVPRSVAEGIGTAFVSQRGGHIASSNVREAREFLKSLHAEDWQQVAPSNSAMSGADYRAVWSKLSGEPL